MKPEIKIGEKTTCNTCGMTIIMTNNGWDHVEFGIGHLATPAPPVPPKSGSGTKPHPFEKWMPIQHIDMTPYVVAMRKYISERDMSLGKVDLRSTFDQAMRQWVFDLEAYMAAINRKEEVKEKTRSVTVTLIDFVEVPTSWWQHFKFSCFPRLALDIWPVKLEKMYVKHSEEIAVNVVENHVTKVCPHLPMENGPKHLSWMAGDSRCDEIEEAKEVWRLRSFLRRLTNPDDRGPDCLYYDCAPRVIEEAKKALEGKS